MSRELYQLSYGPCSYPNLYTRAWPWDCQALSDGLTDFEFMVPNAALLSHKEMRHAPEDVLIWKGTKCGPGYNGFGRRVQAGLIRTASRLGQAGPPSGVLATVILSIHLPVRPPVIVPSPAVEV
jgi:hypothetical protein